jgi:peptidoglycan biosynthesis protein MviN/MurJ (putative lipid II flippase)
VLAGSVSIVAAAPIAAGWDRDPRSLGGSIERAFRLAVLILVPCVAAVALIGSDIAGRLLSSFGSSEVRAAINSFLALSPLILAAQATAIPLVALYALHRHAAITRLAIGAAALQAGLATGAVAVGGIVALGVATSISSLAFAAGLYVLLYGCRLAIHEGYRRMMDLLSVGVPAAACFVAPAVLGVGRGLTLVIGLVLLALLLVSRALWRRDPSAEAVRPEGA